LFYVIKDQEIIPITSTTTEAQTTLRDSEDVVRGLNSEDVDRGLRALASTGISLSELNGDSLNSHERGDREPPSPMQGEEERIKKPEKGTVRRIRLEKRND
jgi:hypothetical protein